MRPAVHIPSSATAIPSYVYAWDRNGSEFDKLGSATTYEGAKARYDATATYGSARIGALTPATHNTVRT